MKLRIPENLTQRAYRAIRDDILKGRLNQKRRLTEGFFVERLGVSKSPVREALNRLEADGLVVIEPRRGATIVNLSIEDVNEIYELRELLEAAAVRHVTPDQKICARLRQELEEASAALRKGDKAAYVLADAGFHRVIAQANTNIRLRRILDNMYGQMLVLRHRTYELSSGRSVVAHGEILDAMEKGNTDLAARLMTEHIRAVRSKLIQHLEVREGTASSAAFSRAQRRPPARGEVKAAP
jgi:DNA-binding GntR family transcriptional regulator